MGKKNKGGNPKLIFQQATTKLQEKHFSEAAAILRRAKFPPKEKKKADQLNINIHYFWALDAFENKDYLQAITILRMFVERFKKKISLPIEKANMLLGLSYFYTNDFKKAADYLVTAKNSNTTQSFYFYYLLALIYQKKYADIVALTADHEEELTFLNPNQKTYLGIAIALVQADYEKVETLLADFETNNKTIEGNIIGLQSILKNIAYPKSVEQLKPIYKSFLNLTLSDSEKKYLGTIPAFNQQVENLKNNQLQTDLIQPLKRLCEKGLPLTNKDFNRCMELPEAYRPHIVYNQVAALFNEDLEIEENEIEAVAIIKKYAWHFFQVPEAIFLFAQIVYWNPENFSTTFFWKNIATSLDRFGKTFSSMQLNRLSWRLMGCSNNRAFAEKSINRKYNQLVKTYPQMLGLKWKQIADYVSMPEGQLLEEALDIFTFPNFQYGNKIAMGEWESLLLDFYPDPSLIYAMLGHIDHDYIGGNQEQMIEEAMDLSYKILLTKAQEVLIRATTEQEVHLKNKVVLDFFKFTNYSITKFEKDRRVSVNERLKKQFFEAYHKMIILFEEDSADSEYLQDYRSFEQAPKINRLAKVLEEDEKGKVTVEILQEYLAKGDSSIIHQVLLDELRYTTFIENALHKVQTYFNLLIMNSSGQEPLENVVKQFGNLYIKKLRLPYVPNYPDSNFFEVLEQLTKEGNTPNHILTVSILTEQYMSFLTRVVEPMYYNMAEKILSYFIKAKKKQPKFDFNLAMIQQLKDFVKKAVSARKLKKLGTTLANAEKVFPALSNNES